MKSIWEIPPVSQREDYKTEVPSGITVALALIPGAVAFAFPAGLPPLTGLFAAFVLGLVTSIPGSRSGMISDASGAIASESQAFRYRGFNPAFGIYHFRIQSDRTANGRVDRMDEVIVDFALSRILEKSSIESLNKITERDHKVGKKSSPSSLES